VSGHFARGDTVSVLEADGVEIARGMIAYSDKDAVRIIGKRSGEIESIVGFRGRAEMIHRDDLVIVRADSSSD
jgi:glutamate 5-kinase